MEQKQILSVSQLNELVRMTLETQPLLEHVYLRGEISNFTNHYKTGHYYFSLKDSTSTVRAVMFARNASACRFMPENGMLVIAEGRVSAYVRDGQYQIYVDRMEPDGVGSLAIAYEQLKAKLEAEGLFAEERRQPIPKYPKTIGIITSPTGAAVRDIIQIAQRRYPPAKLLLFPTQVQGTAAPAQLTSGILYFNRMHLCDVIIIGRGGGSFEDLYAFNNEALARAIAASSIPVISAVGHETDFTICDFVADLRAPTPSAAAELAVPESERCKEMCLQMLLRMQTALCGRIRQARQRLTLLSQHRTLRSASAYVDDRRLYLLSRYDAFLRAYTKMMEQLRRLCSAQSDALENAALEPVKTARNRLAQNCGKLDALSPLGILRRGYGAVYLKDGQAVTTVEVLKPDSIITLRLADGHCDSRVLSTEKEKQKNG